jgi:hypothetical protein
MSFACPDIASYRPHYARPRPAGAKNLDKNQDKNQHRPHRDKSATIWNSRETGFESLTTRLRADGNADLEKETEK